MRTINPEHHRARRKHILEAAVACFMRKGFHATRTAEICAEANMSPGNLFHYFPNKEAIIIAIVEEDQEETAQRFVLAAQGQDLYAALLDLIQANLHLLSDPVYTRIGLEIVAEATRSPLVAEHVARSETAKKAQLILLLKQAEQRRQLQLRMPAEQAADWILLVLDGTFGRALADGNFKAENYHSLVAQSLAMALEPLQ